MRACLLVMSLMLICSCHSGQGEITPAVKNISESVYASGIVKSQNQYQVYPAITGTVEKKLVKEGDLVHKGDPLLLIHNPTTRLNIENAALAAQYADVNANRQKIRDAELSIQLTHEKMMNDSLLLIRQRSLWAQNIGSKVELEQKELNYTNSKTSYESAVYRYTDLKKQLNFSAAQSQKNVQISNAVADDYTIRSTMDGRVFSVLKEAGEIVNPQNPVAVIGNANDFLLELQVDEYDIANIRMGQEVLLHMDSYRGNVFKGQITEIEPYMNDRSRTFTVKAAFITKPQTLYPNLTAEANIIIRTKERALTIPRSYLIDETYVMLKGGKKVKVTTGLKDYQEVEITSGITSSDIIVKPAE
ncbi:efflux RND transporter periplasmic adaptor subunit [Chitinophagaceae bacterium MMS25-I14]